MKKFIFVGILVFFSALSLFVLQQAKFNDGKLHLVFCDVGQGDAIFIRSASGSDILVDGGPDNKVLSCLSNHMPFWDRTIELVILTHPHADHLNGLIAVFNRYKVLTFASEALGNKTAGFSEMTRKISEQKIKTRSVYAGGRFSLADGLRLEIVGPSREFLEFSSPNGLIGEGNEFASLETLITYKNFSAILTGDSQVMELEEATSDLRLATSGLSVLQVPHHGSRFGLSAEILDILNPKLAVISVGKNNKYGHPAPSILKMLRDLEIKILRTDQNGEVEIISDGKTWKAN